ncbi:uncharacterized protein LOC123261978 [Cotesia glomerata]|uniref:uncharacterized protein LOC123261978 n=1 Tax=Cotesia glomerata TaxID=32391 RepID=UPI001D02F26A|nr:uncharacterized protein LOC123261978 [Cotesia glomerata]
MLAAPFCRELHFGNMLTSRMQSHVPRCLFGSPNPKDSVELLQESLDMERSKFERRWGIDPCQEDKENVQRKFERSPRKNRSSPYSRQTCIHDYWRSRKSCDVTKKSLVSSVDPNQMIKKQEPQKTTN